jgi:hypothetical protein
LTLVVVGLALAPPLGWLLGAWLAGPSDIPADDPPAAPLRETLLLAFEPDESAPHWFRGNKHPSRDAEPIFGGRGASFLEHPDERRL